MPPKPSASSAPVKTNAAAFDDIIGRLAAKKSPLRFAVITVDGGNVDELLAFNTNNRKATPALYKAYANKMLRGVWSEENGETLVFSQKATKVRLLSGQHRLLALKEANRLYELAGDEAAEKYPDAQLKLTFAVIYGAVEEDADTIDTGKSRNHTDVLFRNEEIAALCDEENSKNPSKRNSWCRLLAGAARLVWLRSGGNSVSSALKFDTEEMLEFVLDHHKGLASTLNAVLAITTEEGYAGGLRMSLAHITALVYIACKNGDGDHDAAFEKEVIEALRAIGRGEGLVSGTPEHSLTAYWNKLISTPGSKHRDFDWIGPFVKFLNALATSAKDLKPTSFRLSDKERKTYNEFPPLLPGQDQAWFEAAAEAAAEAVAARSGDAEPEAAE